MKFTVITNNPLVNNKIEGAVYNCDASFIDILIAVRNKVHLGHILLTHPLSGSVGPGQTPYKSVVISAEYGEKTDFKSISIIEDAIAITRAHVARSDVNWNDKALADFQLIDYSLIADIIC